MNPDYAVLAEKFARNAAEGKFVQAHALFIKATRAILSPEELNSQYEAMTSYGQGPATHIEVMQCVEEWPEKQVGDLAWAYVAIASDTFSEAVSVVIAQDTPVPGIRTIEWGRP